MLDVFAYSFLMKKIITPSATAIIPNEVGIKD